MTGLIPEGCPGSGNINLTYDEYEVIRLLDYIKLTQEQCAEKMNISRPTVTRIYNEARQKIADVLVNGQRGDVTVCEEMRPECAGKKYCCHR